MTFPAFDKFNLVVAANDPDGNPDFIEVGKPTTMMIPGSAGGAAYWRVDDGHSPSNIGGIPNKVDLAGPNGSAFSVVIHPANSAGKLDMSEWGATMRENETDDPAMHATDTIDYEIILSGKVDIELPGGKVRTLVPGDLLVMAGAPHAWKNRYDEDCIYVAVTIGYNN